MESSSQRGNLKSSVELKKMMGPRRPKLALEGLDAKAYLKLRINNKGQWGGCKKIVEMTLYIVC
jgi:hypothetical protein